MPRRTDIQSILVIGAGPIIIGQACEFDYSGTQAVKALKGEGYRVILVNSNPATIMTDPEVADATYIEPITPEMVEKIIIKEKPDALLPTMGGQTALNTALAPIISTPHFFSAPDASSASAVFSAVCPPIVGSRASGRSLAMILATISGVIGSI